VVLEHILKFTLDDKLFDDFPIDKYLNRRRRKNSYTPPWCQRWNFSIWIRMCWFHKIYFW